jgi:hypothetical protein
MSSAPLGWGKGYVVMAPAAVMRPRLPPSVNHRAPSGPVVMLLGLPAVTGNSVIAPLVVMRPML